MSEDVPGEEYLELSDPPASETVEAALRDIMQPVVDAWMEGDHGGTIYTAELTGLLAEAINDRGGFDMWRRVYDAGYEAAIRAAALDEARAAVEHSGLIPESLAGQIALAAIDALREGEG